MRHEYVAYIIYGCSGGGSECGSPSFTGEQRRDLDVLVFQPQHCVQPYTAVVQGLSQLLENHCPLKCPQLIGVGRGTEGGSRSHRGGSGRTETISFVAHIPDTRLRKADSSV